MRIGASCVSSLYKGDVSGIGVDENQGGTTELRREVDAHPLWYHTLALGPGLTTPGWFDLRPVVDSLPWPDVTGARCLDVGTYDGFLAFELERRAAAEVKATDISHPAEWDWSLRDREHGVAAVAARAGTRPGAGFEIARRALGSSAERVEINVYDLDPARIGTFDVVTCGSLLLHLRDPIRALEAIRSVCHGVFLSMETIRLALTAAHPRRPVAEFRAGRNCQWWVCNAAGHRQLLESAGFAVERASRPYSIPFGKGHSNAARPASRGEQLLSRVMTGRRGVPHSAILARPARSAGAAN
jgi:tRNA (mo5U34)-methyltransferase